MQSLPEYTSFDEKRRFFAPGNTDTPWLINTQEEFDKLYDFLCLEFNRNIESGKNSLLYRGVCEARYKTFTSAQRHWLLNNWKDPSRIGFIEYIKDEIWNIRQWNELKNFYTSLDVTPTDILYLSFLQHFGGATPLLDVTHSLDVGLFFAFDGVKASAENDPDINKYVTLQILDYSQYSSYFFTDLVSFFNSGIENARNMVEEWEKSHPGQKIDISLIEDINKFTAWYNPSNPGGDLSSINIALLDFVKGKVAKDLKGRPLYWSNIRLIAQHGAFLFFPHADKPLEEYLTDIKAPQIRAININKDLSKYVLSRINVDRSKIYPSEESFAKDANIRAISYLANLTPTSTYSLITIPSKIIK